MANQRSVGALLTRIRNAQMRRKEKVSTPGSKLRAHVLDVLKEEAISVAIRPRISAMAAPSSKLS